MPKFKFLHGENDIKKGVENTVAMFLLALDSGSIRISNGRSYAINGEYDKAIADYTEVIRLYPDDQDAFERRRAAYEALGQ
jgi:tetratricopeptide (TPR) repeat protein